MPTYEVKAWVSVQAESEREAEERAGRLLDLLPPTVVGFTAIEGEGAVYEIEDAVNEDGWDGGLP